MDKVKNIKSTLFIIIVWIMLFLINKKINIMPLLCGKGINNIAGEYYRFFTGTMMHNSFIHLLANCATLYWIGYYLEKNIGSGKFLIFGTIATILSEMIFYSIYSNVDVSFGGSVFIFSFIGLILVLQFLKPEFQRFKLGTWYGNWILIYGIVSNIPILPFMNVTTIVIHCISFSVGILLGLLFPFII